MKRGDAEKITERRRKAWEMKKEGYTFRDIAKANGCALDTAHRDVMASLAEYRVKPEEVELYKTLQNESMNTVRRVISQKCREGSLGHIDRLLKIEERRAKLLGLDSPEKFMDVGDVPITEVTFPPCDDASSS